MLSLEHLALEGPDGSRRHLLFSGGTDGGVAIWDVSTAVDSAAAKDSSAANGSVAPTPLLLRPAALLPRAHQSGVNSLAAVGVGPPPTMLYRNTSDQGEASGAPESLEISELALLLSGGDDQALHAVLLDVSALPVSGRLSRDSHHQSAATSSCETLPSELPAATDWTDVSSSPAAPCGSLAAGKSSSRTPEPSDDAATAPGLVAAEAHLPNAHCSALRAVWTDGRHAFSTGLDQRVRSTDDQRCLHGSLGIVLQLQGRACGQCQL